MALAIDKAIVVTGALRERRDFESNSPITAIQEELGDLKVYRVPEHVTVAAKGLKQVAFLDKEGVRGKLLYQADCQWWAAPDQAAAAQMRFETVNDEKHGLGVPLPNGGITFFEPSARGELFVGEQQLRDYAKGQDVEIPLGESAQVFATCTRLGSTDVGEGWGTMRATLTNGNPHAVTVRVRLGSPQQWRLRGLKGTRVKDGESVYEVTLPANGERELVWDIHRANSAE